MEWVDRVIEATAWRHQGSESDGWDQVETELMVVLPTDFKELSRRFVPGRFSAHLELLRPSDDHEARSLAGTWSMYLRMVREDEMVAQNFAPYGIYEPDSGSGLIPWAGDDAGGQYYWLADRSVEPHRWPVVARQDGSDPWQQFDMSTAEFVYRVIADPEFGPFSVATGPDRAFYLPYWEPFPSSREEWETLRSRGRQS